MSIEEVKWRLSYSLRAGKKNADSYEMVSQAGQDIFALAVAEVTGDKSYLEIGAKMPYYISNTRYLEDAGWTGVSIELEKEKYQINWKKSHRDESRIHWGDALKYDYTQLPKKMGFLSCDIDPPWDVNIKALQRVIGAGIQFDSICYEHNAYLKKGQRMKSVEVPDSVEDRRAEMEAVLIPAGYRCVVRDALVAGQDDKPFEDWFVHESVDFPEMTYDEFLTKYEDLFFATYGPNKK